MANLDALMGVGKNLAWETPDDVFSYWNSIFKFDIDLAANAENAKLSAWLGEEHDSLKCDWGGLAGWLNPPYGRGIGSWVSKARYEAQENGALVCALLPVRTDARWWQQWVIPADYIYYIPGRLKFVGAESNAPFPNAIVVWLPYGGNHRV